MAYVEVELRKYLIGDTAITDDVSTRVYPVELPQAFTAPAIRYSKVSAIRHYSHGGSSNLPQARMQIDIWAATYLKVKEIADNVRKRIEAFKGTMEGIRVYGVFLDNEIDFFEDLDDVTKYYRVSQDYMVWSVES